MNIDRIINIPLPVAGISFCRQNSSRKTHGFIFLFQFAIKNEGVVIQFPVEHKNDMANGILGVFSGLTQSD